MSCEEGGAGASEMVEVEGRLELKELKEKESVDRRRTNSSSGLTEDEELEEEEANEDLRDVPFIDDGEIFEVDFADVSEEEEELEEVRRPLEETVSNVKINISEGLARSNYEAAGTLVDEEPERITIAEYNHLIDEVVDTVFNEVLADAKIKYTPVDFQRISVNVLAKQKTLILISPTGTGKMNIPLWANLVLRKLQKNEKGLVIVIQPLSAIMNEKVQNDICEAAVLSMTGNLSTSDGEEEAAQLSCSIEELLSGKYAVIFGHPESFDSKLGMFLLRELQKRDMILLLCLDEFHQGTTGHWDSFRPDMLQKSASLRLYAVDKCPTIAMSATATDKEIKETVKALGLRTEPIILCSSPVQAHIKISMVRRPANNYGLEGNVNNKGVRNAGLLDLLDRIYVNHMLEDLRYGREPKKAIIFCRMGRVLGALYANMMERTGYKYKDCRDAPFVMCHSSLLPPTEAVLERRKDEYFIYYASNRMLMGVDKKDIDIVIFTQPFNKPATTLQGGGRGGRRLKEKQDGLNDQVEQEGEVVNSLLEQDESMQVVEREGALDIESSRTEMVSASKKRRKCQVYQLFNSQVSRNKNGFVSQN